MAVKSLLESKLVKGSLEWIKEKTRLRKLNFKAISIKGTTKVRSIGKFGSEVRLNGRNYIKLQNILNLPHPQRWRESERFFMTLLGGKKLPIKIDGNWRYIDVFDGKNAFEIKTYKISDVPLTKSVNGQVAKDQILKDMKIAIEYAERDETYNPVWIFAEKAPSQKLINALEESGIQWVHIIK